MNSKIADKNIHVVPLDDLMPHSEVGVNCACNPTVEVHGVCLLVIHNSFDGREMMEEAIAEARSILIDGE